MDLRRAYRELAEENARLQRSLAEANQTIIGHIDILEVAKAECEDLRDLRQEVADLHDALAVLSNLHQREYRDGTHWCRECLYQWPCRTRHVISQLRR